MILDRVFGQEEGAVLDHRQMKSALEYQKVKDPQLLTDTESQLLMGSLTIGELRVKDIMIPLEKAFCLDINAVIDADLLVAVTVAGYSRLPVVDYGSTFQYGQPVVVGLLQAKDFLILDPESAVPITTLLPLLGRDFLTVDDDEQILSLMRNFRSGASQLACVKSLVMKDNQDPHWRHSGFVTLQDVLNAIVQCDLEEKELSEEVAPLPRFFLERQRAREGRTTRAASAKGQPRARTPGEQGRSDCDPHFLELRVSAALWRGAQRTAPPFRHGFASP
eukprot:NODE_616_length_1444_cov_331.688265.p2 GENE.NODE_616_length_1444_cov_331.688265~~NODE_616_length_1444_cov_331.688265.p2  ORF type:complete len:323 (-),score=52.31 NODE_616_length_1444_cov_331.688265:462-1292(-)